jgi:small subunit ribosomal protein S16
VDVLGSYDPHSKKSVLKAEKIKEWIGKGAQVSDSVYNLFVKEGVVEGKKRAVKMERPKPVETPAEEVAAEPADAEKKEEAVSEETKA